MSKRGGNAGVQTINSEIFTLTYGSIVRQLLSDFQDVGAVNNKLEEMGYNMGVRMIDEFLAKSGTTRCVDFREVAEKIAKIAFKMFLGINATVASYRDQGDEKEASITFDESPMTDFVELPEGLQGLRYWNMLCGALRGSLEMVNMRVKAEVVRDMLRGDEVNEVRIRLIKSDTERYPFRDD